MRVSVERWGNSLGVCVPEEIATHVGLREGATVEMTVEGTRIVLASARPSPRFTLDELLVGMTPEAMHEAFDWGDDLGRERMD